MQGPETSNPRPEGASIDRADGASAMTMPSGRKTSTSPGAPADAGEMGELVADLAELRGALAALFRHPELVGLSTSALSRALDVDRSTLQRLVQTARGPEDAPAILEQLPGARGLQRCVEAWRDWAPDDVANGAVERLREASDRVERSIRRVGGTRPRALEQLRSGASPVSGDPSETTRERMFEDAARVVGSWCDCAIKVFAYATVEGDSDHTERVTLEAMRGFGSTGQGLPLLLSLNTYYQSGRGDDAPGQAIKQWVDAFSTSPPMVASERSEATRDALVLVEPDGGPSRDRDLCVVSDRQAYAKRPSLEDVPMQETIGMVHYPARRLLQVLLLEREIYRESTAHWAEAKAWRPSLGALFGDRFLFCLPDAPGLTIIDRVPGGLSSVGIPELAPMIDHLVERSGWADRDFVALVLDVDHPIWRFGYSIGVEFG